MLPTLVAILTIAVVAVVYWFPLRRWMSRWGATPSDLTRVMPGDALLVDPDYSGTMAVTVNTAPNRSGHGSFRLAIGEAGCTATTGSIGCSAISIVQARLAFFRSFNTLASATGFLSAEAQAGRWPASSPIARWCWI